MGERAFVRRIGRSIPVERWRVVVGSERVKRG